MTRSEWAEIKPHKYFSDGTSSGAAGLPSAVDNLAFAILEGATRIANAISPGAEHDRKLAETQARNRGRSR